MQEFMRTDVVLDRAADEIEHRGWVHGPGWVHNIEYRDGKGVCAEGALQLALGIQNTGQLQYHPVYNYMLHFVAERTGHYYDRLWEWNDNHSDTKKSGEKVVQMFRDAAWYYRDEHGYEQPTPPPAAKVSWLKRLFRSDYSKAA